MKHVVLFSRLRFARTSSRSSRPPSCSSTTQNRLATGNKVNSALDNPTNFFTAQGLNNRASDINNLLDSIGNGVQVLQAANTGITSLQKLVDTAKSIANQVLQAPAGYSTKSTASPAVASAGATAANLLTAATLMQRRRPDDRSDRRRHGDRASRSVPARRSQHADQLNTALAANNLQASVDGTTELDHITTTNDAASATIGTRRLAPRLVPATHSCPLR